ncbi:MAG: class I SAM-dependent methyltransferase [Limnoraphis sp. WC205]|jgi:hypothetical protein|nr:class I SAM-dependent methyltransferase [Limnoraphis sp. WC205]
MWYKTFLPKLHEIVKPNNYLEIGIRHGYSLSLSPLAKKIAIDPSYGESDMQFDVQNTTFFKMTSDDFFKNYNVHDYFKNSFDLGYIDGMHLFEYALRDFINLEKASNQSSIIIIDDVIPRTEEEANRQPSGGAWTGDVWKIISCLAEYRQDLASQMILAKSEPTGCLIIVSPDNKNSVLFDNYDKIINKYLSDDYPVMPDEKIQNISVSAEKALDILSKRF